MPTTGKINGTLMILYVGGTAIGSTTSHSLSTTMETRPASTKNSAGWAESLEGQRSWSMDFEGFVAFDETYGFTELFTLITNRTASTIKVSSEVTGDPRWTGSGYLTDLSMDAGVEDTVTFSGSFTGTSTLTEQTVT